MGKLRVTLALSAIVLLRGAEAHAISAVTITTEVIQGRTVEFENSHSGKYPLQIKAEGQTLTVLDPHFHPPIVTDGTHFYELNETFAPVTQLDVTADGNLAISRLADGKAVLPGATARVQIAGYLFGKSREVRAAYSAGTESFLIETEKEVGTKIISGGFDAGASLIAGGKNYLLLGSKRYPNLISRENRFFSKGDDGDSITALRHSPQGELTSGPLDGRGKDVSAKPKTKWAYFNFVGDNWKDYSPEAQKSLKPFLEHYLKERGPGVSLRTDGIVYPDSLSRSQLQDEKGKPLSQAEVTERALNFVLNFIGSNKTPQPAKLLKAKGGTNVDLAAFLAPEFIARLVAKNPYLCSPEDKVELRLDWLVSAVLNDTFYRELTGIPATLGELDKSLGIETAFKPPSKDRVNVAAPISGVAHVGRVASAQPQKKHPGRTFFGTYDFAVDEKGKFKNPKGDFKKHPTDFEYTGGEFIWEKDNGYPAYALYVSDGKSLAAAPDSLVSDTESKLGPFIKNPASCLHCHSNGSRSWTEGTMQDPDAWILTEAEYNEEPELKKRFPKYADYEAVVNKHYGEAKKFEDKSEKSTKNFVDALLKSKAFVASKETPDEPAPLLPEFYRYYNDNMNFHRAAKELGATYEEFKKLVPASGRIDTFPERGVDTVDVGSEYLRREQFERVYCSLKARLQALRESPEGKEASPNPEH